MNEIQHVRKVLLCVAALVPLPCLADLSADVARILGSPKPPAGVVFEVVSGDLHFLAQRLPAIREHSERLRAQFPDLPIAVVTHGIEEFSLTRDRRAAFPELHAAVETLSSADNIPVHVCGTHAGWWDLSEDAFPDYVDVAPIGPVQVRTYQELGYELILVQPGDG